VGLARNDSLEYLLAAAGKAGPHVSRTGPGTNTSAALSCVQPLTSSPWRASRRSVSRSRPRLKEIEQQVLPELGASDWYAIWL
jgi:hypothetical protein